MASATTTTKYIFEAEARYALHASHAQHDLDASRALHDLNSTHDLHASHVRVSV